MKSIHFTPEHEAFRTNVRNFMQQNVLPFAQLWEQQREVPREVFAKLGHAGLLGLHYPLEFGGQDKDIFYSVILLEELGRTGFTGFRVAIAVHAYMAIYYILHAGNTVLKKQYLQPAIAGEKICCLAISEPHAGSDIDSITTNATLHDDYYVVNGHKKFVANAQIANFIIAAVKTGSAAKNISLLIIDTNTPGIKINNLDTYNWHSSGTGEIIFDNVQVPKTNVLGAPNMGFIYMMQCLQLERIVAGILALGGIDCCLDHTWTFVNNRKVFKQTLSKYQALRHQLADLVAETEVTRQFAYHTAWLYSQKNLPIAEASILKLKATELARKVSSECIQFHGAHGCLDSSPISRMYRDAQAGTIAGGASEIMRDIIAQITLDESGWRRNPFDINNLINIKGELICPL